MRRKVTLDDLVLYHKGELAVARMHLGQSWGRSKSFRNRQNKQVRFHEQAVELLDTIRWKHAFQKP